MAAAITTTMSTMSSASIRSEGRRPLPGPGCRRACTRRCQACTRVDDPPITRSSQSAPDGTPAAPVVVKVPRADRGGLPADRDRGRPGCHRRLRPGRRRPRLPPPPRLRPHPGCRPRGARGVVRVLRHQRHLPRAAAALLLAGRHHRARVRHRHPGRPPAPDRPPGQAGGRARPAHGRRPAPPRSRHRLERGRVPGPRPALRAPRGPARGADHPPAAAVDRAERHLRGAVRHRDRGRHRAASGNPPHPAVARGGGPRRARGGSAGWPTGGSPCWGPATDSSRPSR